MKKLGEGWQYSVYDLGNGRVLKKFHSWPRAYWVMIKENYPYTSHGFSEFPEFIRDIKEKAIDSMRILKQYPIPSEWIGNPKFLNQLDFEQDKVRPLHDVFDHSGTEEIKRIVDQFMDFNKKCLEIGFVDKAFNITKNNGLNKNGEIVLSDIGELFDDPARIKKQLEEKVWYKSYVGGCIKDLEARKYFLDQMDKFAKMHQ